MQGLPTDSLFLLFRKLIRNGEILQVSGLVHLGQFHQIGRLLSVLLDHRIQTVLEDEGGDSLFVQFLGDIDTLPRIR